MKLGILAGEASGDILGAGLINSLHALTADLNVTGIGGSAMIQAGCQSLYEMECLSVMGYVEPLFRLPQLLRLRSNLYSHFMRNRPDVFVGIDSPGFNLGFELKLRQAGIPVVHYVGPSVWAWRKNRIFKIAKAVDLMLTLFPFEEDIYKQHHIPVKFVGHPLADVIPLQSDKIAARKALGIDPDATYIALLPGSRHGELKYLSKIFLAAATLCLKQNPRLQFITSAANVKRDLEFKEYCNTHAPNLPIIFFEQCSHNVMAASDVVLVASGTATLETMLFKRPMVVAYRLSPPMYKIASRLVSISMYSLPNLLAKEALVPEFIQDAAIPEALSAALLDFLNHPEKSEKLEKKFLDIHQQLRCNASQQAAKTVIELLNK